MGGQHVQYQPYFKTTDYTGGIFQYEGAIKGLFLLLVEKGNLFVYILQLLFMRICKMKYFLFQAYFRRDDEGISEGFRSGDSGEGESYCYEFVMI